MASRRWLRGESVVSVILPAQQLLTTLGASRSTGPFDEVRRVYGDFATALGGPRWWTSVSRRPSYRAPALIPANCPPSACHCWRARHPLPEKAQSLRGDGPFDRGLE